MKDGDLGTFVDGAKEAGFVADAFGRVLAWNEGAERLFGVKAADAIGNFCDRLVKGMDQSGPVCSSNCQVRQAIGRSTPLESFDIQAQTPSGPRWCNVTVVLVKTALSPQPHAFHLVRPVEVTKHLELALGEFVKTHADLDPKQSLALQAPTNIYRHTKLSDREREVLELLSAGGSTKSIASKMSISPLTVNNHIRNILRKTDSHSRLSAIMKAGRGGLL